MKFTKKEQELLDKIQNMSSADTLKQLRAYMNDSENQANFEKFIADKEEIVKQLHSMVNGVKFILIASSNTGDVSIVSTLDVYTANKLIKQLASDIDDIKVSKKTIKP